MHNLIEQLNHPVKETRIDSLKKLYQLYLKGDISKEPVDYEYVNNHIHTTYSFSPYSPTKALWMAFMSGLKTAGIMDHDSVGGNFEFIEAGKIINMATTVGMECRVDMSETKLSDKRINNPDQKGIAYVALHGIPHTQLDNRTTFVFSHNSCCSTGAEKISGNVNVHHNLPLV
jgi:hypothetical protein